MYVTIDVSCYLSFMFFNQLQNNSKLNSSSVIDCLQKITFNKPSETFLSLHFILFKKREEFYPKRITHTLFVCSMAAVLFILFIHLRRNESITFLTTSEKIIIDTIYRGLSYTVTIHMLKYCFQVLLFYKQLRLK